MTIFDLLVFVFGFVVGTLSGVILMLLLDRIQIDGERTIPPEE